MSPARKEGYYRTPVGWIPTQWRFLPIDTIAQESTLRNGNNTSLPVILCSKHVGFVRSLDYFKKKYSATTPAITKWLGETGLPTPPTT
ncbi:hypothetical protein ACIGBJ_19295 [Stutzerimonas stutzeri]|uniref:hypothetical protein n=1 Tax=Stutzerimonas stutzeri TaxID=316 RepID=UPI0037D40D86